jgi:hypothetical protein
LAAAVDAAATFLQDYAFDTEKAKKLRLRCRDRAKPSELPPFHAVSLKFFLSRLVVFEDILVRKPHWIKGFTAAHPPVEFFLAVDKYPSLVKIPHPHDQRRTIKLFNYNKLSLHGYNL